MPEHSQGEPSPAEGTAQPDSAETRWWGSLATGLVGGLAAAALLILALHLTGWLSRADPALVARVEALESAAAGAEQRTSSSIEGMEQRISSSLGGVEQRVAALEGRPLPQPPPAVDLAPLRAAIDSGLAAARESTAELARRVEGIESSMADIKGRIAGLAASSEVEAQGGRIAAMEIRLGELGGDLRSRLEAGEAAVAGLRASLDEVARAAARSARGALALVELDRALATGRPLEEPLRPLREISADDATITGVVAELEPLASAGVPTLADLRARLSEIADSLPAGGGAGGKAPSNGGWVDRTLENITGLVKVRELGTERGAVDEAGAALDRGDLQGAVAALEPVAEGKAEVQSWLAAARQRLAAEAALERLRAHLAALVDPVR